MAGRFDSFVMFAGMRTGSNFLEANLNALPGVHCHGEAFNPHFIGKKDCVEYLGMTIAQRDHDPLGFLARLRRAQPGLAGFRFFHDHDPRVLAATLADPACAKIVLTRNPLESYVSLKIAQATGQWKLTRPDRLKTAKARFEAEEFEAHLDTQQAFQKEILHGLQTTGQTAFYLDYEDVGDLEVLNGLAAFLGADERLAAMDGTLKKQNPEEIAAKVQNPSEMAAALARLDRFGLNRTPNFEPRRGPAIPRLVAAAAAPLLLMPIKGGPDLAGWLGGFGQAGVQSGFTQKELRAWKRANPGFRSFAVLRHPVLRAYGAFAGPVMSGRQTEVLATLTRTMKQEIPPATDLAGHRTAFVAFLGLVKQALSGQSNLRVAADWASQTAILQGYAQVQLPDHLLREDDLGEGLRRLAEEIGLPCPAPPERPAPAALLSIYDESVETAVREAYHRDYVGFGFTRWR
jgi:LPS sulfotransferase NodH